MSPPPPSIPKPLIMIIPKRAPPTCTAPQYNQYHRRERQPRRSAQMRGVALRVGADALGDEVEEDEVDGKGDDDEYQGEGHREAHEDCVDAGVVYAGAGPLEDGDE